MSKDSESPITTDTPSSSNAFAVIRRYPNRTTEMAVYSSAGKLIVVVPLVKSQVVYLATELLNAARGM